MKRPNKVVPGKPILKILRDPNGDEYVIELYPGSLRIRPKRIVDPDAVVEVTPAGLYDMLLFRRVAPIPKR